MAALALLVFLTPGCTSMSGAISALGNDPAIVNASLTTVYGTMKITRIGGPRQNQTVAITPDGTVNITNVGAGTNSAPATVTVTSPATATYTVVPVPSPK